MRVPANEAPRLKVAVADFNENHGEHGRFSSGSGGSSGSGSSEKNLSPAAKTALADLKAGKMMLVGAGVHVGAPTYKERGVTNTTSSGSKETLSGVKSERQTSLGVFHQLQSGGHIKEEARTAGYSIYSHVDFKHAKE